MNKKGSKHLSLANRFHIESSLSLGMSLKETAESIGKDERTVSKEVRKRRKPAFNGRSAMKRQGFVKPCRSLMRWPYVCNGCRKRSNCFVATHYTYDAKEAQASYEATLRECREGIDMTLEEKIAFDAAMRAGVEKGQSIHAIVASSDAIKCSERTAYRLVDQGKTVVQNIDLRRKVKLKKRRAKPKKAARDPIPEGSTYNDFIRHCERSPGIILAEIDTVMPAQGYGKCLLTIHFPSTHFMLARLLEARTQAEVAKAFEGLKESLGKALYSRILGTILTDRGTEFRAPSSIEVWGDGEKVSSVFYCDPYCSWQKGAIEENHTLVRTVIPKGEGMDGLTQEKVDLMMSHVNSYPRKSLRGRTPYDLMLDLVGEEGIRKAGIARIDPGDVILNPKLLK